MAYDISNLCCKQKKYNLATDVINGSLSPLISIIVPLYNTSVDCFVRMITSVIAQTYENWELVLVDDCSLDKSYIKYLNTITKNYNSIVFKELSENVGISQATNIGVELSSGSYLLFLDHDDELSDDALKRSLHKIIFDQAHVVYSDQDTISQHGDVLHKFYKPDWSPTYLMHVMYVGHLLMMSRNIFLAAGMFDSNFDGVQDFELMLRVSEITNSISHVKNVLYHWKAVPSSLASSTEAKSNIEHLQSLAVQKHLDRIGIQATASPHIRFRHRCVINNNSDLLSYKISIIIPTKDQPDLIYACLNSIFNKTKYKNFEVVVVDTGTTDPRALKVFDLFEIKRVLYCKEFNFSDACNFGAKNSTGDIFIFLNNDTEVITPDWIENIIFHFQYPDVGIVGPLLLYPDMTVQHAGVVLGARGTADHVMRNFPHDSDGYAGSLSSPREVSAVTGACLAIRKDIFNEVGMFNDFYAVHYQDVDLCLKVRNINLRCIFTPYAQLFHHESPTRGPNYDFLDRMLLLDSWSSLINAGDPYYNPNLSLARLDYSYMT